MTNDNEVKIIHRWVDEGYLTLDEGLSYINNRLSFIDLVKVYEIRRDIDKARMIQGFMAELESLKSKHSFWLFNWMKS